MSIRGIDTQIMITRLPDNVKEASAVQKRPEIAQEYLAAQQRINDAEDQSRVSKTLETEMDKVRTDAEEGGSGSYEGGERRSDTDEEEQDDGIDPGMIVAPGNNRIDIKV